MITFITLYNDLDEIFLNGNKNSIPAGSEHLIIKCEPSENKNTLYEEVNNIYGLNLPVNNCLKFDYESTLYGSLRKYYTYSYYKDDKINTLNLANVYNKVSQLAKNEWIFKLDCDERVSIDNEDIAMLQGLPDEVAGIYCYVHSLELPTDNTFGHTSSVPQLRLYRKKVEFINKIHEQNSPYLSKNGLKSLVSNILIKHLGYAIKENVIQKSIRNIQMLGTEIQQGENKYLLERLYKHLQLLSQEGYFGTHN